MWHALCTRDVVRFGSHRRRGVAAQGFAMIRIEALWLCTKPVEMGAGAERLFAHGVHALASANAHVQLLDCKTQSIDR